MADQEARDFLSSLLNKTLHVSIIDGRLFTGSFRCTDRDSNIILSNAFEYRAPSKQAEAHALEQPQQTGEPTKGDMTSRFMGLIVVPKHQIIKIELEERRSETQGQELPLRPKE